MNDSQFGIIVAPDCVERIIKQTQSTLTPALSRAAAARERKDIDTF
jgi:hypothetical protein